MIKDLLQKLLEKKYLLIMLVLGIVIMIVSGLPENTESENRIKPAIENRIEVEKLEKILKKINGVKSCDVFVTYENCGENIYAYDVSGGTNRDLEIKLGDKEPLIKSIKSPEVRGVFVLVEGDGVNENEVTHIINGATGVPMHRVYVKVFKGE